MATEGNTRRRSTPLSFLLDVPAAAAALSISERSLYRLMADGRLPSKKVGGRRLFRTSDLEEFAGRAEDVPVPPRR